MGYLLSDHESARPGLAVMLGPLPHPVNRLVRRQAHIVRVFGGLVDSFGFVLFETKQAQIPTKGLATSLGKMRGITALVEMN